MRACLLVAMVCVAVPAAAQDSTWVRFTHVAQVGLADGRTRTGALWALTDTALVLATDPPAREVQVAGVGPLDTIALAQVREVRVNGWSDEGGGALVGGLLGAAVTIGLGILYMPPDMTSTAYTTPLVATGGALGAALGKAVGSIPDVDLTVPPGRGWTARERDALRDRMPVPCGKKRW